MKTSQKNGLRILFLSAIIPKEGNLMFQQKRWSRAQVQTEMVEFIALRFPSSKKKNKKRLSFHVVVGAEMAKNVQKNVMHVQICCFAS